MAYRNDKEYLDRYRRDPNCFGGDLLRGNPKRRRPYGHDKALHVTMRSSIAKGHRSLHQRHHYVRVKQIFRKQSRTFGITIYKFANSGNHIHLLIRPPKLRSNFAGFIKAVTGLIARMALAAERGCKRGLKFWEKRPFSRVVPWGRPFGACARYVMGNVTDTMGKAEAAVIEDELKDWRRAKPS